MEHKTLIFLHIPKTGGRSLQSILLRKYSRHEVLLNAHEESIDWRSWPDERKRGIRYMQGHFIFGAHQDLPQECSYVTMLREPIDRVISLFYYLKRNTRHPLNRVIVERKMDLETFITSGISDEVNNNQTRLVSGASDMREDEMLDIAKEHIDNRFAIAGVMEHFDETLVLLKKQIGLRNIFYGIRNQTINRPAKDQEPAHTLQLINEHNRADIELYAYAKSRLDKMIEAQGESFAQDLERFRKFNQPYNTLFHLVRRAKNTLMSNSR